MARRPHIYAPNQVAARDVVVARAPGALDIVRIPVAVDGEKAAAARYQPAHQNLVSATRLHCAAYAPCVARQFANVAAHYKEMPVPSWGNGLRRRRRLCRDRFRCVFQDDFSAHQVLQLHRRSQSKAIYGSGAAMRQLKFHKQLRNGRGSAKRMQHFAAIRQHDLVSPHAPKVRRTSHAQCTQ